VVPPSEETKNRSGTRLYIFISTSYIALSFYCEQSDENVQAMLLYGAKRKLCVDILYDDVNQAHIGGEDIAWLKQAVRVCEIIVRNIVGFRIFREGFLVNLW
jgi:hypothetical protein